MNESKAAGILNEGKGKVKQALGETLGNQSLADQGAIDQVKGHAQEAWGSAKDTAGDLTRTGTASNTKAGAEVDAQAARNKITNAAEHAKESIERGLGHLEKSADK